MKISPVITVAALFFGLNLTLSQGQIEKEKLIGHWELIKQSPSKKEITGYTMIAMGMKKDQVEKTVKAMVDNGNIDLIEITEETLRYYSLSKTSHSKARGKMTLPYKLKGQRLLLPGSEPGTAEKETKAKGGKPGMADLLPRFLDAKLADGVLTLTSNPIKPYDNKKVIYQYKKTEKRPSKD